ncbi:MAG TPA: serine/threonine-protein kinase [Polyangiales bacterium]
MRTPSQRRFVHRGSLPAGTALGDDLTLLDLLGEGGTGQVYRAYHSVLKREVAVKMCHARGPGSQELSERLIREARMCASVRDPRVPRMYALSKLEDGTPYLVMEMVRGEPLSELLARGRLRVRMACELGCELLRALEAVHRAQVVHRDVKPSNLIVDLDSGTSLPRLRLLDFGIGKVMRSSSRRSNPALTRPGEVVGTPMYMAPEQMLEGAIDQRVDVYAAGIVLFEMLAGRPPFRAPSVAETFVAVLHDEMPDLAQLRPGLPPALVQLVTKAASKSPAHRYESATEMRRTLEAVLPLLPAEDTMDTSPVWERSDEHSPTLVWQRPTDLARSRSQPRSHRPFPTGWGPTLRAVERGGPQAGLPLPPLGFLARRPSVGSVKPGGWRVVSACM